MEWSFVGFVCEEDYFSGDLERRTFSDWKCGGSDGRGGGVDWTQKCGQPSNQVTLTINLSPLDSARSDNSASNKNQIIGTICLA